ncbi:Rieske (2Fe-2S) protein [Microbispora sp. NPDC049125]|uniref:Rieske (2Fe-2S) protein n=1 Tax=Microbispora sp. NPDC049125 TaxID=3154929 RepID=UPI003467A042
MSQPIMSEPAEPTEPVQPASAAEASSPPGPAPSRRTLFTKAVLAGTVALFTRVALATPAEAGEATEAGEETADGVVLAKTKSIPLHGGKIIKGKYVVTHPAKGVYRCFTAKCTHQGCTVATIRGGTINCPCHGSKFSIVDGHVVQGPATRSLPKKKIKVSKGVIRLA